MTTVWCAFQFTNCPCGRYISVSNQAITCCKSLQGLLPIPNSDSACTISRAGETRKRARAGAELGKENERFILFIHIELPRERERERAAYPITVSLTFSDQNCNLQISPLFFHSACLSDSCVVAPHIQCKQNLFRLFRSG